MLLNLKILTTILWINFKIPPVKSVVLHLSFFFCLVHTVNRLQASGTTSLFDDIKLVCSCVINVAERTLHTDYIYLFSFIYRYHIMRRLQPCRPNRLTLGSASDQWDGILYSSRPRHSKSQEIWIGQRVLVQTPVTQNPRRSDPPEALTVSRKSFLCGWNKLKS